MTEQDKAAFDFAQETTKQCIGLATGVLALTITFLTDVVKVVDSSAKPYLFLTWILLFISVVCGLWTLQALTGTLEPVDPTHRVSIRGSNVIIPAGLQVLTFLGGLAFVVIFAIHTLGGW